MLCGTREKPGKPYCFLFFLRLYVGKYAKDEKYLKKFFFKGFLQGLLGTGELQNETSVGKNVQEVYLSNPK